MIDLTTWISWKPASEPGALDGWKVTCSRCGYVGAASIHSIAVAMSRSHLQWHINQTRRQEEER